MKYILTAGILSVVYLSACSPNKDTKQNIDMAEQHPGQAIYNKNCKVCHAQGINGAPILGNKKMWAPRLSKDIPTLTQNAITGVGLMPPKGGRKDLPYDDIELAVQFMVEQAK